VRFARRNEHHNSKQPILVLFDDEAKTRGHTTAPITEPRPGKKIVSFLLLSMYTCMLYGFEYGKLLWQLRCFTTMKRRHVTLQSLRSAILFSVRKNYYPHISWLSLGFLSI
jgi:hypothetical protein